MTVFAISMELLFFLQPDLFEWYIVISRSVYVKIKVVFEVMVRVKVQNFIESVCILHLLYH